MGLMSKGPNTGIAVDRRKRELRSQSAEWREILRVASEEEKNGNCDARGETNLFDTAQCRRLAVECAEQTPSSTVKTKRA
eukprot:6188778-Pleurochrysis_carterae.AAC.3